jgi:formylglycine-generating enzyme required for sulfatase activity/nucleoside phosphorylase
MSTFTSEKRRIESPTDDPIDFGVIVALPLECAAVLHMLDAYERLPPAAADPNIYFLGTLALSRARNRFYRIVVAQCPKMGNNGAAMVAKDLIRSFGVRHVFMTGIAAGVPCPHNPERHVRLGDVVVSYGRGVIQYDFAKRHADGTIEYRGALPPPSRVLTGAVDVLEVYRLNGQRPWERYLGRAGPLGIRPDEATDVLRVLYGRERPRWKRVQHPEDPTRVPDQPKIHYGIIGSGNSLIKDIHERERLADDLGIIAIEMEGAGVADATWNQTEVSDYLIIRGISDYADRQKNDTWKAYAAVAAAAYLRALLESEPVPPANAPRLSPFSEPRQDDHLQAYLLWLINTTRDVVIRGGQKAVMFPISSAFTSIELETHGPAAPAALIPGQTSSTGPDFSILWPSKPLPAAARPAAATHIDAGDVLTTSRNALLLGPPGSGKTTLLQYLALSTAQRFLASQASSGISSALVPAIPIMAPLNAVAARLQELPPDAEPAERTLLRSLEAYVILRQSTLGLPQDFFVRLLHSGHRLLLLLDALDEIADENQRIHMARAIEDLTRAPYDVQIILTARPHAHRGQSILSPDFEQYTLQPLAPDRVKSMVNLLCAAIYQHNAAAREEAEAAINQAIAALEVGSRVADVGRGRLLETPLMVRVMITSFLKRGHAAEQRTELFRDYIDTVLEASYNPDAAVASRLSSAAGTIAIHRALLSAIAMELHQRQEYGTFSLRLADVERVTQVTLARDHAPAHVRFIQDKFLELTRDRGGILYADAGEFKFSHLAFQEFLVGNYLYSLSDEAHVRNFLQSEGRIGRSWWQEPVVHLAGLLKADDPGRTRALVQWMLDLQQNTNAEQSTKLGALELAARISSEWDLSTPLRLCVATHLAECLVDPATSRLIPLWRLAELGRLLGLLGDVRPDIALEAPATRLIEAGPFMMGYPLDGRLVDLPSLRSGSYQVWLPSYALGVYPVTNDQYERFVEAGGYSEAARHFWTEAGWQWKIANRILCPAFWHTPPWNVGNHPVVGVSWFEAVAYCGWLSEAAGHRYGLPSEAEWEKAASGLGIWPWGSDFTASRANTTEAGITRTVCVGLFPENASRWGIADMAGNVWEWCNSAFRTYDRYVSSDGREELDGILPRCIRGGSWLNSADRARVANRDHYFPGDRHSDLGFRVAAHEK